MVVMENILDKLRSRLMFDAGADFYVGQRDAIIKLDPSRFVYFNNERQSTHHQRPITNDQLPTTIFIDGGNAEIFSAADFSLYIFRISAISYGTNGSSGIEHSGTVAYDLYAFLDFDEEKSIRIQLFGIDVDFSQELHQRAEQYFALHPTGDLSAVGSVLLQLCELVEVQRASARLPAGSCIVRDGSLDVFFEAFSDVGEQLKQQQIFLCGLSKTNSLRTTSGRSVSLVLEKIGNVGAWHYPVTKHLFFVKLHEQAKQVFRCDVNAPHYSRFASLAAHAADPVFLGYPYGLVEADRCARISREEAAFLRKNMKMRLGKDAANLETELGTSITHEILDKIRF